MVLQKIIFKIFLDNKDIVFVLFVLHIIYMVLRLDQLYHNLGLSIIYNFSLIYLVRDNNNYIHSRFLVNIAVTWKLSEEIPRSKPGL